MTTAFLVGRIIFGGYWLKGISPLQESIAWLSMRRRRERLRRKPPLREQAERAYDPGEGVPVGLDFEPFPVARSD